MNRIRSVFEKAASEGRSALIIYLCGGDPSAEDSVALIQAAFAAGADIVELGVPFSDPAADGPAIQLASERALAAGASLRSVLQIARDVRAESEGALLLFGYLNPLLAYGPAALSDIKAAGVDGLLVVDLPLEEASELREEAAQCELAWVPLVAPTTPAERADRIAKTATGFLYSVSMTGVTGGACESLGEAGARARKLSETSGVPVAVGFGVRTGGDARDLSQGGASGVVVGSAAVRAIAAENTTEARCAALGALVRELREGCEAN